MQVGAGKRKNAICAHILGQFCIEKEMPDKINLSLSAAHNYFNSQRLYFSFNEEESLNLTVQLFKLSCVFFIKHVASNSLKCKQKIDE